MLEPVLLEDIKRHLVLDPDETGDDGYLESMIVGARAAIEKRIRREVNDLDDGELHMLKHAIRLIVGHWFASREAVAPEGRAAAAELPIAVTWLLDPLVSYAVDDDEI